MRLTKAIKEQMLCEIIDKSIDKKINHVIKKLQSIAQKAADTRYPKSINIWIANAPEGGLMTQSSIELIIAPSGTSKQELFLKHDLLHQKRYSGGYHISLSNSIQVLQVDSYRSGIDITGKPALLKQAMACLERLDAIKELKQSKRSVIVSALESCNTDKQLRDAYPELVQYLPKAEPVTKALMISNDLVRESLEALVS